MKIIVCDDHKIVRDGLKQILQQYIEDVFVAEACDGNEALSLIKNDDFDLMLLDISLPGKTGLEVLQTVKAKFPSMSVIMLSMHSQEQYVMRAIKLGASGYLTKDTASEELIEAINKVMAGGNYVSRLQAENLYRLMGKDNSNPKHQSLSEREFEIMIQLAKGKSLLEIGEILFISNKTVSTYRSRIMEKMGLSKNSDLIRYCLENKLVE